MPVICLDDFFEVIIDLNNNYYSLNMADESMYTISSGTKIVLKNCAGVTCLALDLAGQLVVFEEGGMQLVMKGSDNECFLPWKQACRGSSLPSAFKDVRYAVFDDEGDIILGFLL